MPAAKSEGQGLQNEMTVDEDRAEAERFWSAPLNERGYAMVYDKTGRLWLRCPKHGNMGGTCWRLCSEVDADFDELQWYREMVREGAVEEKWVAPKNEEGWEDEEPEKTTSGRPKSFYEMITWDDYLSAGFKKARKKMNKVKDERPSTAPWIICPCPGCDWEAKRGATWEDACQGCKAHTGAAVTNEVKDYKAGEFWKIIHPGADWMAQALPDEGWDWKPEDHLEELVKAGVITAQQAAETMQGENEADEGHKGEKKGDGKKGDSKGKVHHKSGKSSQKSAGKGMYYAVADQEDDAGKQGRGKGTKQSKSGDKSKKGKSGGYGPKPPRHAPYEYWW